MVSSLTKERVMSFFSDVKAVFSAFVDGCVDAAQENKKRPSAASLVLDISWSLHSSSLFNPSTILFGTGFESSLR